MKNAQGKTPMDLIESARDIEKICMVANIGASSRNPLLGPPKKVKGCTYLTILMEKISLSGAGILECPFVRISIYNDERQKVEDSQDISKFCHRNETCLWYTTQFHMQVMLENCQNCFVVMELCDAQQSFPLLTIVALTARSFGGRRLCKCYFIRTPFVFCGLNGSTSLFFVYNSVLEGMSTATRKR